MTATWAGCPLKLPAWARVPHCRIPPLRTALARHRAENRIAGRRELAAAHRANMAGLRFPCSATARMMSKGRRFRQAMSALTTARGRTCGNPSENRLNGQDVDRHLRLEQREIAQGHPQIAVPDTSARTMKWEVVVILDHCTDGGRGLSNNSATACPSSGARAAPGLSHARNRGFDVASGSLMIWMMDLRVAPSGCAATEGHSRGRASKPVRGSDPARIRRRILPLAEASWRLCDSAFAARRIPPGNALILLADNYRHIEQTSPCAPPCSSDFATTPARRTPRDLDDEGRRGRCNAGRSGQRRHRPFGSLRRRASHHAARAAIGCLYTVPLRGRRPSFGIKMCRRESPPPAAAGLGDLGQIICCSEISNAASVYKFRTLGTRSGRSAVARGERIGRLRSRDGRLV